MAWFKKKQSPVDRRLDELNKQIADLESQARRQAQEEAKRRAIEAQQPSPPIGQEDPPSSARAEEPPPRQPSRPRFRTTVTPKGIAPIHGIDPQEVDFFAHRDKPVDFSFDPGQSPVPKTEPRKEKMPAQGIRQNQAHTFLEGILEFFHKPKPPHPEERLVSYLTTGSFQRLKPLRYEKRIARNRLIILIAILLVIGFLLAKFIFR